VQASDDGNQGSLEMPGNGLICELSKVLVASGGALSIEKQEGLAVASIARDDPSLLPGDDPSPLPGMHRDPMHFRHRQTDGQTDADIVA